jgi:hypothetical protein
MKDRLFQFIMMACFCCSLLGADVSSGITATLVPDNAKPGDIIELLVEMDRSEYAKFTLDIPAQPHLHRIAVEAVPVSFSKGRYRQSEKWLLQADSSGDFVIEGGKVLLENGGTTFTTPLPDLKLVVTPYAGTDASSDPVGLPDELAVLITSGRLWLWVLVLILAVPFIALLARNRRRHTMEIGDHDIDLLFLAARELEQEMPSSHVLENLIHNKEINLPEELRARLVEFVYAGRGEKQMMADELRKEAGQ